MRASFTTDIRASGWSFDGCRGTDRIWLALKGTLPPRREGPPLHVHYKETEEGRVMAGTLSAVVDGRRVRVASGEIARFPVGSVHRDMADEFNTV